MTDDERDELDELIGELRGLALTAESHHVHLALHAAADRIEALEAELADADQDLYHVFMYLASAETELNRQAAT